MFNTFVLEILCRTREWVKSLNLYSHFKKVAYSVMRLIIFMLVYTYVDVALLERADKVLRFIEHFMGVV